MEEKTLDIVDMQDLHARIADVQVYGDPGRWVLVCKASSASQGWMRSTKVFELFNGCLVQVSTQQKNPDGSYVVAEALTFVPDVSIGYFGA